MPPEPTIAVQDKPRDPKAVAEMIDKEIDKALADARVAPSPPATDAEFFRRAHLSGRCSDVFAGLLSAAGGILTGRSLGEAWGWGVIGNFRHTPVAFLHGTKDGPSPVWSDQEANRILNELEK